MKNDQTVPERIQTCKDHIRDAKAAAQAAEDARDRALAAESGEECYAAFQQCKDHRDKAAECAHKLDEVLDLKVQLKYLSSYKLNEHPLATVGYFVWRTDEAWRTAERKAALWWSRQRRGDAEGWGKSAPSDYE